MFSFCAIILIMWKLRERKLQSHKMHINREKEQEYICEYVFYVVKIVFTNNCYCYSRSCQGSNFDWNRSFSEPDLTDPYKHLNRFTVKHPHEYISVDDLKYFRRKKPPDLHTKSNICLYNSDEPVLPFSSFKTEYKKQFRHLDFNLRSTLLRRSTSLRLEGLMQHKSEQQDKYHWYSPQDCQSCRSYPIKNPESFQLGGDINMDAEYRSSYICYPMVDRTTKILPREMFRLEPDQTANSIHAKNLERSPEEIGAIKKLAEDKFKRDVAAQEQHKCHLQQRDTTEANNYNVIPSEYMRQYIQFPIEKAHSIPQISHIKMQGDFTGIPEYQDSFKMYANYSKSAPIKKVDNLRYSGAEVQNLNTDSNPDIKLPEYRDKYSNPPKASVSKEKSLKTEDHLRPRGNFSKDVPEYYESFRDPKVKQMPERGKCREPYLRLKGKIEFNPEYRNTYLDFPRSRPIVRKPVSSFRLPTSSTTTSTTTNMMASSDNKSPKRSPRRKYKSSSPNRIAYDRDAIATTTDLTITPEYRRANYNYQLRERTPTRKVFESDGGGNAKLAATAANRKNSDSSTEAAGKPSVPHKRRTSRNRKTSTMQNSFENIGVGGGGAFASKKPAKFGRRATILQNAVNCRDNSSIVEGNPKYKLTSQADHENSDSFVVLNEPCKRSNWMKKSWYES